MNLADANAIRSIPTLVLRGIIMRLVRRNSLKSTTNWLVTQPLGELEHAPVFVVHEFVLLIRKWVALADTCGSSDEVRKIDYVLASLTLNAQRIASSHNRDGDADAARENWQPIDVVTEQVPIQRKAVPVAEGTMVENNPPRSIEEYARRLKPGEYQKLTDVLSNLDEYIENNARIRQLKEASAKTPEPPAETL